MTHNQPPYAYRGVEKSEKVLKHMSKIKRERIEEMKRKLETVVSINEASALYGVTYNAIMYHVLEENIVAAQTLDGRWILDLQSLVLLYGPPPYPNRAIRNLDTVLLVSEYDATPLG